MAWTHDDQVIPHLITLTFAFKASLPSQSHLIYHQTSLAQNLLHSVDSSYFGKCSITMKASPQISSCPS